MGSQYVEFESEAWYRAIADGRQALVSDRHGGQPWQPPVRRDAWDGRRPLRDEPWRFSASGSRIRID